MQKQYSIGVWIESIGSENCMKNNYNLIKIDVEDEKYPQRLLEIKNFPTEIYAIGNIELLNATYTVGIVGARKCTEYGIRVSNEFAKKLSEKEICIISGMAAGIDGIAHNAAIEEKGKTVAVLGSGLNYIYPPENEWLFHKIIEKGGCIISEYSPETEPNNKNFPIRNRIISGLSDAVLVVEAIHRSGSTITAKYAKQEGKLVYAIPNTIYISAGVGTNRLLQEGAILVTDPMQIVEEVKQEISIKNNREDVKGEHSNSKKRKNKSVSVKETEKKINNKEKEEEKEESQIKIKSKGKIIPKEYLEIYRVLSDKPIHINEIAMKLGKTIQEVNSVITMMEIEEYAYQSQTNYFIRYSLFHD